MSRQERAYLAACVREGRPMTPEEREQVAKFVEARGRPPSPDALDRRLTIGQLLAKGLMVKDVNYEMRIRHGVSPRYVDNAREERLQLDRELRAAMAGFAEFRRALSKHLADIMANLERVARESRGSKYVIHRGRLVVPENSSAQK